MLSFERLKELRKALNAENWNAKTMIEVIAIIDEAIARQSVKSEEIQEAIEWQVSLKDYHQNKWQKEWYEGELAIHRQVLED